MKNPEQDNVVPFEKFLEKKELAEQARKKDAGGRGLPAGRRGEGDVVSMEGYKESIVSDKELASDDLEFTRWEKEPTVRFGFKNSEGKEYFLTRKSCEETRERIKVLMRRGPAESAETQTQRNPKLARNLSLINLALMSRVWSGKESGD